MEGGAVRCKCSSGRRIARRVRARERLTGIGSRTDNPGIVRRARRRAGPMSTREEVAVRIGVPKEIKPEEYRVGLTPASVRELAAHGHRISIETGAGVGIGADDDAYRAAGGGIVDGPEEIFRDAELVVKVKEPQPSEWPRLSEGQILFTYLHLAAAPEVARGLMASGCTAVAYETVVDPGGLPLLAPMSEVAGRIAIEAAAEALRRHHGGMGKLLGGVPGVPPARVLVLGGGTVGVHAARMAAGLGAAVTVLDVSLTRLRDIEARFGPRVATRFSTREAVEDELTRADVIVGAVLVTGARTPKLVSRADLLRLPPGAVLVDVAIDQGGCFETSRPTTHHAPTFVVDGIVHYCVANMPGAVPRTSAHALNNATLPYVLALATGGTGSFANHAPLRAGLNVHRGRIVHPAVASSLGLPYADPFVVPMPSAAGPTGSRGE
jgi:alanine dehydrogenase